MPFTVSQLAREPGDALFYDPGFRRMIETHLVMLRNTENIRSDVIDPNIVYKYQGDFYGFLGSLGVPMEQFWVYLRFNDMTHPEQFGRAYNDPYSGTVSFQLRHPPIDTIRGLRRLYLTEHD